MIASVPGDSSTILDRAKITGAVMFCLLVALGLSWANSGEELLAYLLVLSAAALPSLLWLRMGAIGIPVLPAVALVYIPYYAWSFVAGGENTQAYTLWEIVRAGGTVAAFLLTATVVWRLIAGTAAARQAIVTDKEEPSQAIRFVLAGLLVGIGFHAVVILGGMGDLGTLFGLVRSIALTFVTVACFLVGVTRAQGVLRGTAWVAALAGLGLIAAMSWSSLFLVGGMIYLLAAGLGYVLVSKRIPMLAFSVLFASVAVLHAGKAEMRDKYWMSGANYGDMSVAEIPGRFVEWIGEGMYAIATGNLESSVLDRASLSQIILLAQAATPDQVDFLGGETYSMLPSVLVPRFVDADKPASQVGMDLLNIRYGILTAEGASTTAVGWGLIAEAYANFGYAGVFGVALLLGGLCGALALWGAHAEVISIPTLASIAVMMGLINLEADSIQLVVSQLQSFAAVLIFSTLYRRVVIPHNTPENSRAEESSISSKAHEFHRRP